MHTLHSKLSFMAVNLASRPLMGVGVQAPSSLANFAKVGLVSMPMSYILSTMVVPADKMGVMI